MLVVLLVCGSTLLACEKNVPRPDEAEAKAELDAVPLPPGYELVYDSGLRAVKAGGFHFGDAVHHWSWLRVYLVPDSADLTPAQVGGQLARLWDEEAVEYDGFEAVSHLSGPDPATDSVSAVVDGVSISVDKTNHRGLSSYMGRENGEPSYPYHIMVRVSQNWY